MRKLTNAKVTISSKVIYSFSVIVIKLSVDFYRYWQADSKFSIEMHIAMKSQWKKQGCDFYTNRYESITQQMT